MDIGATLTSREARTILRRLNTITRLTDDRRIKEQAGTETFLEETP